MCQKRREEDTPRADTVAGLSHNVSHARTPLSSWLTIGARRASHSLLDIEVIDSAFRASELNAPSDGNRTAYLLELDDGHAQR
jgi:hypothetical protein